MSVWVVLVYVLAVARVTGLITLDEITCHAREWVIEHLPLNQAGVALEYFVTCPWCVSVWVAGLSAPLIWLWGDTPAVLIPALALAASQVTGMLAPLGRPVTR